MIEFDESETRDLKLTTNRFIGDRRFRFVMLVEAEIWSSFLSIDTDSAEASSRDAYDREKGFWDATLQELADREALRLDPSNAAETHTFFPTLDWLKGKRGA